jgi:hypothetical protein
MASAVAELADDVGFKPDAFTLSGGELDARFQLKFVGDRQAAERRTSMFLESLKLGGGKYKPQLATAAGSDSPPIQFFCNPDKNGARVRMEILCKELQEFLVQRFPEKEFWIRKLTGTILVNRKPLVQVQIKAEDKARLSWNLVSRTSAGIEQDEVETAFAALVAKGQIQWS